jgi:hypothetical protein
VTARSPVQQVRIDEQYVGPVSRRIPQGVVEAGTAEARQVGGGRVEPALREEVPGPRQPAQPTRSRVIYGLRSTASPASRRGGFALSEQRADVNVTAACDRPQRSLGLLWVGEPGRDGLPHELAHVPWVALAVVEDPRRGVGRDALKSGANPPSRLAPVGDGATAEAAETLVLAPQARTAVPPQWSPHCGLRHPEGLCAISGRLPDRRRDFGTAVRARLVWNS